MTAEDWKRKSVWGKCQGTAGNTTDAADTDLEVLRNLTDKSLERKFADEELSRLLIAANFTKGDSPGPETMGLLHTTSGGLQEHVRMAKGTRQSVAYRCSGLACRRLGRELFTGSLACQLK